MEATPQNWWSDWWQKYRDHQFFKQRRAEYPEIDREDVYDYPCDFGYVNPKNIWKRHWIRKGRNVDCYVHIPFCKHLCKFCIYNRYPFNSSWVRSYLKALKKEIELYSKIPYIQDSITTTIYFGGGTPTVLTKQQFTDLLTHIRSYFNVSVGAEITLEAHPRTVDEEKFGVLSKLGVNRISFGVQTFNDKLLSFDRLFYHKREHSINAIKLARDFGFPKVCIDLMYRLPSQTLEDWRQDLADAVQLELTSFSLYSLILPPDITLPIDQPSIEEDVKMYKFAVKYLSKQGYHQWAPSEFCLPGNECVYLQHNWEAPQQECLGLGAGGSSFIHGNTYTNIHSLDGYSQVISQGQLPVLMGKELTMEEEMSRYLVLGVKCLSVDKKKFKEMFDVEVEDIYGDALRRLESWGLITVDNSFIRLTEKGKIYLNNISKAFFTENNKGKQQIMGILLRKFAIKQKRT